MPGWWSDSVPVRLSAGMTFNVTSPERAARILLTDWPGDPNTAKHRAARQALLKALEATGDQKRALAARKAFEAAVIEADALGNAPNQSNADPVKTR
jgi:hypothetical protein